MAVKKRKSNWYIYLITFAAASVIAAMFLSVFWDILFPQRTSAVHGGISTDIPDSSNNMRTLFMLSEQSASIPTRFLVVSYQPADEAVYCVPLRSDMQVTASGGRTGTLAQIYSLGGVQAVLSGIQTTVGIKCDNYVKFDRDTFITMADAIGKIQVSLAYDVLAADGGVLFEAGNHSMNGSDLYTYLNYDNADYGADYQSLVLGSAAVSVLNDNLHGLSATVIQSYFTKLMNTVDTDITLEDYTARQQAFLFTSVESFNPGQYYIPYGEIRDGVFYLADDSKLTISERLKTNEE